jgi:flagellar P-ring protein FlgI
MGIVRKHIFVWVALGVYLGAAQASAVRIRDLCDIQGARGNSLMGIGIVTGLAGTGDKAADTIRAQEQMLRRLGVDVEKRGDLTSKNVAIVSVTAVIPPFAKEGTRFDVKVQSVYDAASLEGGTLMDTLLTGADGEVYAVAQGPISVGGFNADASGGTSIRNNHTTAGTIPMGAFVEREIPSTITDGERIMLLLTRPDFGTARNIQNAIVASMGSGSASALGAGTVSVTIPVDERGSLVNFVANLQEISVEAEVPARIIFNERTGTIVVGGDVQIKPCHVAHGGLTIRISAQPVVSQPLPFSDGVTVVEDETVIELEEKEVSLMPIGGASAAEVAEGLNRLKVTPRDMISIFQALRQAGVLDAELITM